MGVSAYDYVSFTNPQISRHESGLMQQTEFSGGAAPLLPPPPSASESQDVSGTALRCPAPPISQEALILRSRQSYASGKSADRELERAWPRRDPFNAEETPIITVSRPSPAPAVKRSTEVPAAKHSTEAPAVHAPPEQAAPVILPAEPHCVLSGTLIESGRRLALVDGMPLSVGDRSGNWILSRIEPDYIILEAGKETRRIELKTVESKTPRGREPR
jgi:hypothetical protein